MSNDREFPILHKVLKSIPWGLIAPHEKQARLNHSQTLERLAERWGLSPLEAVRVLNDQPFRGQLFSMPKDRKSYDEAESAAVKELEFLVERYRNPANWLILCLKELGDNLLWWRTNSKGYTVDLNQAGRYTRDQSERMQRGDDETTLAIPEAAAIAMAKSFLLVDACSANVKALREAAEKAMVKQPGVAR